METPGFIKKIQNRIEDENHWLTRRKLFVLGFTLILVGILLEIFDSREASEQGIRPEIIDLSIPERQPAEPRMSALADEKARLASVPFAPKLKMSPAAWYRPYGSLLR